MRVFIGMETSGALRRRFAEMGHQVISCDVLPAKDEVRQILGTTAISTEDLLPILGVNRVYTQNMYHVVGDVFDALHFLFKRFWIPDLAVFHPTCTFLTNSAAWAFKDPDYVRYPGVGYHQKVKPGTLVGAARRAARDQAVADVERIWRLPIKRKVVENPVGALSTRWKKPTQIVQPNWFGDDASKATCLWLDNLDPLVIDPAKRFPGRWEEWPRGSGKLVERWSNQTPSGQNNMTPSDDRWDDRSETFPHFAGALAAQYGSLSILEADEYQGAFA